MRRDLSRTLLGCAMFACMTAIAAADDEGRKFSALLARAESHESDDNPDDQWQAAALYCEASRLGSIEAQYRLGMLYAFGKGVPENKAYAASLFSGASHQGHAKAYDMLETVNYTSTELPPCITANVPPEKPPKPAFDGGGHHLDRYLASLPPNKSWIIDLANKIAGWYNIDPKFVLSIISVESNFSVRAQSPKSAMGLMQLIPATAERFNVKNAFDAAQNIRGGIRYLQWLLSYYRGNVELVAAAYNAGENAVDRYLGVPPYPETRDYVKRLQMLYRKRTHPYDHKITAPSPIITEGTASRK